MATLTDRQVRSVLDVARAAMAAPGPAEFRDAVLPPLRDAVASDYGNIFDYTFDDDRLVSSYDPPESRLPEAVERAAFDCPHPIVTRYLETGDGSATRLSDVVSLDEYRASRIYREHYRAAGIEAQLSATVPCPEWHVLGLSLFRGDGDFSDGDRAVLDAVRPFLVQGLRSAETRACVRELLEAAPTVAEGVAGAAVLGRGGAIEDATPGIPAVLDSYRKLGALAAADLEAWAAAQRDLLADAPVVAEPLVTRHEDRRLVLRLVPAVEGDVVLTDERPAERTSARLRGFGLTEREADVLLELTRGSTNAQIARALGIAPGTVKTHLERIYRKLGVPGRTAAVALAYEVLARP